MEFKQAHRLENLHVSGTRVVFGKCAELAAQGIPVTALTLGQPDFDTPQYIIDACRRRWMRARPATPTAPAFRS